MTPAAQYILSGCVDRAIYQTKGFSKYQTYQTACVDFVPHAHTHMVSASVFLDKSVPCDDIFFFTPRGAVLCFALLNSFGSHVQVY